MINVCLDKESEAVLLFFDTSLVPSYFHSITVKKVNYTHIRALWFGKQILTLGVYSE